MVSSSGGTRKKNALVRKHLLWCLEAILVSFGVNVWNMEVCNSNEVPFIFHFVSFSRTSFGTFHTVIVPTVTVTVQSSCISTVITVTVIVELPNEGLSTEV